MATRDVFTAEEQARLRGFPEIDRAELIRYFTAGLIDDHDRAVLTARLDQLDAATTDLRTRHRTPAATTQPKPNAPDHPGPPTPTAPMYQITAYYLVHDRTRAGDELQRRLPLPCRSRARYPVHRCGQIMSADKAAVTLRAAIDRFLGSARCRNPSTRRTYGDALDRIAGHLGADRPLLEVTGAEIGDTLGVLWGQAAASTWNQRRAATGSFLAWCVKNEYPAPALPAGVERQPEQRDETRAIDRAAIERLLTRRDIPLREKTLWRMLYETAARAGEILALDIEDLELDARRARIRSKGGAIEYVYWASGTAHLLPRLNRGRTRGPVFLSERRPGPARRPPARDICPDTGRARLGYDRARILLDRHASWDLHQLRHSAATHLGEANAGLQLIMAKGRWRNPRTAMRYVKPGSEAVATVTELLDITPPRRS